MIIFHFVNDEEQMIKNERCYQGQGLQFLLHLKYNIDVCEASYSVL